MDAQRHNFHLGDVVTVFNRAPGGKFVIEGRAAITGIRASKDMYDVKFLEDLAELSTAAGQKLRPLPRYVDPNGQHNPDAYLEVLNTQNSPLTEAQQRNG